MILTILVTPKEELNIFNLGPLQCVITLRGLFPYVKGIFSPNPLIPLTNSVLLS